MEEEIKSLLKNKTRKLVKKLENQRIVQYKWIFKLKEGTASSKPLRYKARLVAIGFIQRKCVDYNEIFSPVVKYKIIRLILALI